VEIRLADHIVVADDDFVSLAQSGYYHPDEEYTVI
jgi:DNA repair protein RadC